MKDLIAKRYAKAIALRTDLEEFYKNLCVLNFAFSLLKFKNIIESSQIKKKEKIDLINSFFEKKNTNFENFVKLLIDNSRLNCVPQIVKELEKQKAFKENFFTGILYSKEILDQESLKKLELKLSQKFNVNIKLDNQTIQDDGVKIELEELGYELSFSMKVLQNKLNEYILKII